MQKIRRKSAKDFMCTTSIMSSKINSLQLVLILLSSTFFGERKSAKFHAIIVDSTSDSPHVEQTVFHLSYQVRHEPRFEIMEQFLKLLDCSDKTGS